MDTLIQTICQREGLTPRTIQPLNGGQVNQVYQLDEQYVLRIGARADAFERLKRETELLRSLPQGIPAPQIYAFGVQDERVYQIQQFVPGQKLYTVWKDLSAETQERIAAELAAALKILHGARFPHFGEGRQSSPPYATWADYLSDKFQQTVEALQQLNIRMAPGFIELAVNYFEEHKHVLQGEAPTLVHSDLNLTNVLVKNGQVAAILDFEFALQAPADYELQAIEAFCLYPNDWAEEGNEVFCTADFASLVPLLRKHDPALFAIPNLRERLNIYHIYSALSSYLEWRKANLSTIPPERMAAKEFYMGRITNILYRAGARMFYA